MTWRSVVSMEDWKNVVPQVSLEKLSLNHQRIVWMFEWCFCRFKCLLPRVFWEKIEKQTDRYMVISCGVYVLDRKFFKIRAQNACQFKSSTWVESQSSADLNFIWFYLFLPLFFLYCKQWRESSRECFSERVSFVCPSCIFLPHYSMSR